MESEILKNQINIVLPVYNEEKRFDEGMQLLLKYLYDNPEVPYRITVLDNASTDKTPEIAQKYCSLNDRVSYKRIEEKGVGIAFKRAVEDNKCEFIGYMDIDMSTDISALKRTYNILVEDNTVGIVNASRYSEGSELVGRSHVRNFVSRVWMFMLKKMFSMKSDDSICGFKFFRKSVIEQLFNESSSEDNGWFLIIEALVRAEKKGICIFQLPVRWVYNDQTKVNIFKVTKSYLKGIVKLKKALKTSEG